MALSPLAAVFRPSLLCAPLVLGTLASSLGCASSAPPVEVVKAKIPVSEQLAVPTTATAFAGRDDVYDPRGRDPFASYLDEVVGDPSDDAPPLARHALGTLKVIGVVSGTATPMAMIQTPEGKGYRVRVGDRIGHHGGRVHGIATDRVIVRETF